MKDFDFQVDTEMKLEYLGSKPAKTANSNGFVLKRVDDYEALIDKKVYDLSIAEIKEMLILQYKNKSKATINKNVSIIRKYIEMCITKGLVAHMENRFDALTSSELAKLVSQQALDFKYITPEDMEHNLDSLFNPQDRGFIYAVYIGIKGRPTEDGTCEELINLQIDEKSIDYKNNMLKLVKNNGMFRFIQIDDKAMDILVEAKNADSYVSNNGVESPNQRGGFRTSPVNSLENYVFRNTGKNKLEPFNVTLINSRMRRIQRWVGNPYLTINSLYMSGMINMAKKIKAEESILIYKDYEAICGRFDYGSGNSTKYIPVLKDIINQYIKE